MAASEQTQGPGETAGGGQGAAGFVSFEEEKTLGRRIQQFLHVYPTTIPFLVLLLGVITFAAIVGQRFFHPLNLSLIVQQVTIIAMVGIAQTLVLLTAGVDLSVGAIMVLSSVVMGRLAVLSGVPVPLAFAAGVGTGVLCGFVNGVVVARLRLPPFIVTLGTWSIFAAVNLLYSKNETLRQQDVEQIAPFLQATGHLTKLHDLLPFDFLKGAGVTTGSLFMIAVAVLMTYVLKRTTFGRHVYATGDEPQSAQLVGIAVDATLVAVYTVAGLLAGLAGWVLIGRIGAVSPNAGATANLDSVTAAVIGGTSLFGGRGTIIGTLFGALIVGVFRNGLALAGLQNTWQELTVGLLIIIAVALDQWIPEALHVTAAAQPLPVTPVLQARGLTKRYGKVVAIDQADFELMPGEILGVIGDNGAGKSTLIKVLAGAVHPDAGEVLMDGKPVHFRSPLDARAAGIETVYQNLALSPALSVAENMFLGRERRKPGLRGALLRTLDISGMRREARERLGALGLLTIQSVDQPVETLSGGQRQGIAVARATAFGSRVLIMDEPTAALGVKESRRVLELILDVKRRGLPIILISHNMPHVFEVADRIHIHRLGRRIAVIDPKQYSMSDAVAIMTGAMKPRDAQAPAPA